MFARKILLQFCHQNYIKSKLCIAKYTRLFSKFHIPPGTSLLVHMTSQINTVAVSDTYQDDISDGYSIPDEKPTIGYFIQDEIPTTCFQLCELV